MKTLLLIICTLVIFSSQSAKAEEFFDSCRTQELLARLNSKDLLGTTAKEIVEKKMEGYGKTFGGCRFTIENPSTNFSTFFVIIKSNNAIVFSKELGKLGYTDRSGQIQSIEEGIESLKDTLLNCGCTKLD